MSSCFLAEVHEVGQSSVSTFFRTKLDLNHELDDGVDTASVGYTLCLLKPVFFEVGLKNLPFST